jgi:hypothetical protein
MKGGQAFQRKKKKKKTADAYLLETAKFAEMLPDVIFCDVIAEVPQKEPGGLLNQLGSVFGTLSPHSSAFTRLFSTGSSTVIM